MIFNFKGTGGGSNNIKIVRVAKNLTPGGGITINLSSYKGYENFTRNNFIVLPHTDDVPTVFQNNLGTNDISLPISDVDSKIQSLIDRGGTRSKIKFNFTDVNGGFSGFNYNNQTGDFNFSPLTFSSRTRLYDTDSWRYEEIARLMPTPPNNEKVDLYLIVANLTIEDATT